jgi:acetoin utilization deacetylase AcuC-like enzyme
MISVVSMLHYFTHAALRAADTHVDSAAVFEAVQTALADAATAGRWSPVLVPGLDVGRGLDLTPLRLVHLPKYIALIVRGVQTWKAHPYLVHQAARMFDYTVLTPETAACAVIAALGVLYTARAVVQGCAEGLAPSPGLAFVRPGGLHATRAAAAANSLFCNVGIAAKDFLGAAVEGSTRQRRVLLVNFSWHHANGLQEVVTEVGAEGVANALAILSVHSGVTTADSDTALMYAFPGPCGRPEVMSRTVFNYQWDDLAHAKAPSTVFSSAFATFADAMGRWHARDCDTLAFLCVGYAGSNCVHETPETIVRAYVQAAATLRDMCQGRVVVVTECGCCHVSSRQTPISVTSTLAKVLTECAHALLSRP